MVPSHTWSSDLELALRAVTSAGEIVRRNFGKCINVEEKVGDAGVVTDVDKTAEQSIVTTLRGSSSYGIMGEEGGLVDEGAEIRWVIDPLDGTTNYSRGIPLFAVSLALMRANNVSIGVILDVMSNRCFFAETGKGAFVNGCPIRVAEGAAKGKRVMFVNSGYKKSDEERAAILNRDFAGRYASRKLGSTALELCYVASGCADAFLSAGDELWDFAAGICLIREAGGAVLDWRGDQWKDGNFVLAGAEEMLAQLVAFTSPLQA